MVMMTWLADALKGAGLNVVEEPGWKTAGHGQMDPRGVLCHHTAGSKKGNSPSLNLVIRGRSDLPGPLSHLFLARDGTFHVIAAGRTNHAGRGSWHGASGNTQFVGIEAENAGDGKDPWPEVQVDAYARGVAAILKKLGLDAVMAAGHKEYCLPKGRKIDPSFDMFAFRERVEAAMEGSTAKPPKVAKVDPERAMLRKGSRGESVAELQRLLKIKDDGLFGAGTEAAVKAFQASKGLKADGIVGPATWRALLALGAAQPEG